MSAFKKIRTEVSEGLDTSFHFEELDCSRSSLRRHSMNSCILTDRSMLMSNLDCTEIEAKKKKMGFQLGKV